VVELNSAGKRILIVAVTTLFPELTAMNVVRLMTGLAIQGQLDLILGSDVHSLRMACIASCLRVRAPKRELGRLRMVKGRLPPSRRRMTGAALLTKASGMDIFACVAARASLRQLSLARGRAMARNASRLRVGSAQREATLLRMIEVLPLPRRRLVAIGASRSESSRVRIIDRMAGIAIRRRPLVLLRNMATAAASLLMCAGQGIFRLVVIEASRAPTALLMALAAVIRKRITMNILFSVAGNTIIRCFPPRDIRQMALATRRRFVTTQEGIVGLCMVECGRAQTRDVCVAAHMVGMTTTTLAIQGQWIASMKPFFLRDIAGHQLMTGEA